MTKIERIIGKRAEQDGGKFSGFLTVAELQRADLNLTRINNKPVSFKSMLKQRQFFRLDNQVSGEGRIVKGHDGEQIVGGPVFLIPAFDS